MENKQNTGLNRNIIDKYYTKKSVAKYCVNKFCQFIKQNNSDTIIEPSAGNGSFIKSIKKISNKYKFYDIEPENNEIIKQDFLEIDITQFKENLIDTNKIHIIGNPPFGRQSSMAIKFIKKACLFASSISFILPCSFKKDSMKKYFNEYFHLLVEEDLPKNAFLINNTEYDVPCVFQIWEKKYIQRVKEIKEEPLNFKFISKNEKPDISFRRVGANAGFISTDINNKSIQSHYFIKFNNNKLIKQNIELLKNIKFPTNNTVGPRSISKNEIIKEFNKLIKK